MEIKTKPNAFRKTALSIAIAVVVAGHFEPVNSGVLEGLDKEVGVEQLQGLSPVTNKGASSTGSDDEGVLEGRSSSGASSPARSESPYDSGIDALTDAEQKTIERLDQEQADVEFVEHRAMVKGWAAKRRATETKELRDRVKASKKVTEQLAASASQRGHKTTSGNDHPEMDFKTRLTSLFRQGGEAPKANYDNYLAAKKEKERNTVSSLSTEQLEIKKKLAAGLQSMFTRGVQARQSQENQAADQAQASVVLVDKETQMVTLQADIDEARQNVEKYKKHIDLREKQLNEVRKAVRSDTDHLNREVMGLQRKLDRQDIRFECVSSQMAMDGITKKRAGVFQQDNSQAVPEKAQDIPSRIKEHGGLGRELEKVLFAKKSPASPAFKKSNPDRDLAVLEDRLKSTQTKVNHLEIRVALLDGAIDRAEKEGEAEAQRLQAEKKLLKARISDSERVIAKSSAEKTHNNLRSRKQLSASAAGAFPPAKLKNQRPVGSHSSVKQSHTAKADNLTLDGLIDFFSGDTRKATKRTKKNKASDISTPSNVTSSKRAYAEVVAQPGFAADADSELAQMGQQTTLAEQDGAGGANHVSSIKGVTLSPAPAKKEVVVRKVTQLSSDGNQEPAKVATSKNWKESLEEWTAKRKQKLQIVRDRVQASAAITHGDSDVADAASKENLVPEGGARPAADAASEDWIGTRDAWMSRRKAGMAPMLERVNESSKQQAVVDTSNADGQAAQQENIVRHELYPAPEQPQATVRKITRLTVEAGDFTQPEASLGLELKPAAAEPVVGRKVHQLHIANDREEVAVPATSRELTELKEALADAEQKIDTKNRRLEMFKRQLDEGENDLAREAALLGAERAQNDQQVARMRVAAQQLADQAEELEQELADREEQVNDLQGRLAAALAVFDEPAEANDDEGEEDSAVEQTIADHAVKLGKAVASSVGSALRAVMQGDADLTRSIFSQAANRSNASARGLSAGDTIEADGVWFSYLHSNGKQKGDDNLKDYSNKLDGVTVGVEGEFASDTIVGAAFTAAKSSTDVKAELPASTKSDFYAVTVYGNRTQGNWVMNSALSYGMGSHDHKLAGEKASSKTKALGLSVGGGYNYALNSHWTLQPNTEFNLINVHGDDVKAKDVKVSVNDLKVTELGAGIKLVGEIPMDKSTLTTEMGLKHFHNFTSKDLGGSVSSTVGSQKLTGIKNQHDRGVANFGVGYGLTNSLALGLGYDYDFSHGYKSNSVKAKLSYQF